MSLISVPAHSNLITPFYFSTVNGSETNVRGKISV